MAIANIGTGVGFAVSGSLVDAVGYRQTFMAMALLSLLALPLLFLVFQPAREREAC